MLTATHVCGHRPPGSSIAYAALGVLTTAVCDRARALGLIVVQSRLSRIPGSPSRHIQLRDAAGRDWFIRLSDHRRPKRTGYACPHFDLVTRDGDTGAELAFGFVARVARGAEPWTPAEASPARRGIKPKMRRR